MLLRLISEQVLGITQVSCRNTLGSDTSPLIPIFMIGIPKLNDKKVAGESLFVRLFVCFLKQHNQQQPQTQMRKDIQKPDQTCDTTI